MGKKISTQKVKPKVSSFKDSKKTKCLKDTTKGMREESIDSKKFIKDTKSTNDISWYTHYPDLVNDVGSIFMSRPNGQDYPHTNSMDTTITGSDYSLKQGGFLRVMVQPSWGGFTKSVPTANNAINVAASKLYYYVVHGNSRNTSYDKSDLMKAFMTFDSLAMVIAEAKRVYSFIKAQDLNNRWVRRMVEGLGWNYDNLTSNIVRFRSQINLIIEKFNQISLPDLFDIFRAHVDMFSHVYRDRTGAKCQYSAAVSSGVWLFTDEFSRMDFCTNGKLNGQSFIWGPSNSLRTVDDFYVVANYMLSTIYDSTDIGEIRADILMAFKDSPMITATMLQDEMELPISYDEEWNLKLHNVEMVSGVGEINFALSTTPNPTNLVSHACYVDDPLGSGNLIYYNLSGTARGFRGAPFTEGHIMDLPDHIKTDRDAILLMQQLKYAKRDVVEAAITPGSTNQVVCEQFICGAFAVQRIAYYYDIGIDFTSPDTTQFISFHSHNQIKVGALSTTLHVAAPYLVGLLKLSEFGVTLPLTAYVEDASNHVNNYLPMLYEVENLTVYSDDVLYNVLHTCIESLFYNSKFYNV